MPTLPKIFRPVTRNTVIFYLALQMEFLDAASSAILFREGLAMVLIRLHKCGGWSVPLLLTSTKRVFSTARPNYMLPIIWILFCVPFEAWHTHRDHVSIHVIIDVAHV